MSTLIDTITKLIGVGITAYVTVRYGTTAVILMLVFGCAMTVYTYSEHIEDWWRHRGEE